MTVLVLEDVDRSAQFRAFAQLLDVPADVLVSRMDLTSNRSMTAAEAELLVRLNKKVKKELQWDEYVRYVRRGVALGMVEGREPGPDEPRLFTPDWALDAAAEKGRQSRRRHPGPGRHGARRPRRPREPGPVVRRRSPPVRRACCRSTPASRPS